MKLLKKIRRIASSKRDGLSGTNNLPPITFHPIHGDNIRITGNGTIATRVGSFCKGICFSNRPIQVNERVCIRFMDMSSLWSGLLRFGFTTKDPGTFRNSLPKYACPDLTNSGHTYAKALPERYAQKNNVLHFYVSSAGNVHFGINGEEKGVILSNLKLNGPLWALIDVYGNTTKIEFVDPRCHLNNRAVANNNTRAYESERLYSSVSMVDLPDKLYREPSPQIYASKYLEPMQLHSTRGCNIRLSSNKCIAERNSKYYSQGYVFSGRPLGVGEKLVLQVLKTDELYAGSLAFGLTTCDPSYLNLADLPDDSHQLLDRPEYWVVIKDVASKPMAGDEIAFSVTASGEVQMTKNRQRPITLMHVDISQPLWGFFDLFGSTLKVRLLGTQFSKSSGSAHQCRVPRAASMMPTPSPLQPPRPLMHSMSMHNMHKMHQQTPLYASNGGYKRSSAYQQAPGGGCSEKRVNLEKTYQHNNALNSSIYQHHQTMEASPAIKSSSSNSGTVQLPLSLSQY